MNAPVQRGAQAVCSRPQECMKANSTPERRDGGYGGRRRAPVRPFRGSPCQRRPVRGLAAGSQAGGFPARRRHQIDSIRPASRCGASRMCPPGPHARWRAEGDTLRLPDRDAAGSHAPADIRTCGIGESLDQTIHKRILVKQNGHDNMRCPTVRILPWQEQPNRKCLSRRRAIGSIPGRGHPRAELQTRSRATACRRKMQGNSKQASCLTSQTNRDRLRQSYNQHR